MVVALKFILSTIPYKYYSETCKRKIFKIGCCCIRIVRKNISLMIVTFIIIGATTVTTALVQSEHFKTSSYYVLASPQQKENVTITVLVQRLGKEDMVKELLNDAVNKDPIILTFRLTWSMLNSTIYHLPLRKIRC
jgi:hypothetical protein